MNPIVACTVVAPCSDNFWLMAGAVIAVLAVVGLVLSVIEWIHRKK